MSQRFNQINHSPDKTNRNPREDVTLSTRF